MPTQLNGIRDKLWQRQLVAELGLLPQPRFVAVDGDRVGSEHLADVLLASPGSHILKPRFGSNGVSVVRVVSANGTLLVASDCPATGLFLDEFPADASQRGRDVVAAAVTQRHRFLDRATAGVPEWAFGLSLLEDEIRQDRADGSLFEPRVVMQRTENARFAMLGGICKRIDTPISAVVARDFRELSLGEGLELFLTPRVPPDMLAESLRQTRDRIRAVGELLAEAVLPFAALGGVRVHQFGIDGRLCWNPVTDEAEFWFLEIQVGIGRIDGPPPPGYETPPELRRRFGPETG